MENNNVKKNKKIGNVKKIIAFIAIVLSLLFLYKFSNKVTFIQLQNNTDSIMMGYVIRTRDSLIVIDGGTREDAENLKKNIAQLGGKVDYWFITHPHIDHMGAFLEIANNTDIDIGKVYTTYNELDWYKKYANERPDEANNVEEFLNTLNIEKLKGKVEQVNLNDEFQIASVNVKILGVANPEITTNAANNSSMIIKMQVNDKSILFLGDAGEECGKKLLNT